MRKDKGMTLAKLSEVTGLSPAIVSQIERGLANPSSPPWRSWRTAWTSP